MNCCDHLWPDVTRCGTSDQVWPDMTSYDWCHQLGPDVTRLFYNYAIPEEYVSRLDKLFPSVTKCDQDVLELLK